MNMDLITHCHNITVHRMPCVILIHKTRLPSATLSKKELHDTNI